MDEQKPGQVITPGGLPDAEAGSQESSQPSPDQSVQPEAVAAAVSDDVQTAALEQQQPITVASPLPSAENTYDTAASFQHDNPEDSSRKADDHDLQWVAEEHRAHDNRSKSSAALLAGSVAIAVITYIFTRDVFSTGAVLVGLGGLVYFMSRKADMQQYALDSEGIYVGNKLYSFHDFRGFSVLEDESQASIIFIPLRRFMPPITAYLDPAIEQAAFDYLTAYLPLEEHVPDAVDKLVKRLRF